jgi:hypothetical protein
VQRAADAGGMLLRAKRWHAGGGRNRLLRLFYAWYDGWATLFYAPTFSEAFGFLITWSVCGRRARTAHVAHCAAQLPKLLAPDSRVEAAFLAAYLARLSRRVGPRRHAARGGRALRQAQYLFLCRLVVHLFFQVWEEENSKVMAAADAILVRHIGRRRHPSRKRRTTPDTTGQR